MNLLQTIWSVLTTENAQVANYITIPLIFIEALVTMLLFTTVLNISTTKKSKIIYVFIASSSALASKFIIPAPYGTILNMLIVPISIIFIFKTSVFKAVVAVIIQFVIAALLESIFVKFYAVAFNINFNSIMAIPIHRIVITSFIYIVIFLLYLLCERLQLTAHFLDLFDNLSKKAKIILSLNVILAVVSIAIQFYIIVFYLDSLSTFIAIASLLILTIYTFISFYTLMNTTKLEVANRDLEQSRMYNKTLSILYDNIRAFKHDFANIVQTIGRLCCY